MLAIVPLPSCRQVDLFFPQTPAHASCASRCDVVRLQVSAALRRRTQLTLLDLGLAVESRASGTWLAGLARCERLRFAPAPELLEVSQLPANIDKTVSVEVTAFPACQQVTSSALKRVHSSRGFLGSCPQLLGLAPRLSTSLRLKAPPLQLQLLWPSTSCALLPRQDCASANLSGGKRYTPVTPTVRRSNFGTIFSSLRAGAAPRGTFAAAASGAVGRLRQRRWGGICGAAPGAVGARAPDRPEAEGPSVRGGHAEQAGAAAGGLRHDLGRRGGDATGRSATSSCPYAGVFTNVMQTPSDSGLLAAAVQPCTPLRRRAALQVSHLAHHVFRTHAQVCSSIPRCACSSPLWLSFSLVCSKGYEV